MDATKQEAKKPEEAKPEAVAAPKKRLVKVKALRPIMSATGVVTLPGKVCEVEEDIAKEMCTPSKGHFTFFGERLSNDPDLRRADLTRAELVA